MSRDVNWYAKQFKTGATRAPELYDEDGTLREDVHADMAEDTDTGPDDGKLQSSPAELLTLLTLQTISEQLTRLTTLLTAIAETVENENELPELLTEVLD